MENYKACVAVFDQLCIWLYLSGLFNNHHLLVLIQRFNNCTCDLPFQLKERLGKGAQGAVYLAENRLNNVDYVLKKVGYLFGALLSVCCSRYHEFYLLCPYNPIYRDHLVHIFIRFSLIDISLLIDVSFNYFSGIYSQKTTPT